MKSSRCIICLIYSKCSAGYECGGCMKHGGSSGWNLSSGSSKESASGNILETASSGSNRGRIVSVSKRSNRSKRSNMCIGAITVEYAIISNSYFVYFTSYLHWNALLPAIFITVYCKR